MTTISEHLGKRLRDQILSDHDYLVSGRLFGYTVKPKPMPMPITLPAIDATTETNMSEPKICECCEKRPADHVSTFTSQPDVGMVHYCDVCDHAMRLEPLCGRIRANRQSKLEPKGLEALEFVAPRDLETHRWNNTERLFVPRGSRVQFDPADPWVRTDRNGYLKMGINRDEIPRIHAELTQLRDGTGERAPNPSIFRKGDRVQLRNRDFDCREACGTIAHIFGDGTVRMKHDLTDNISYYTLNALEPIPSTSPYYAAESTKPTTAESMRVSGLDCAQGVTCNCQECNAPVKSLVAYGDKLVCVVCKHRLWEEGWALGYQDPVTTPEPERHASDWECDANGAWDGMP